MVRQIQREKTIRGLTPVSQENPRIFAHRQPRHRPTTHATASARRQLRQPSAGGERPLSSTSLMQSVGLADKKPRKPEDSSVSDPRQSRNERHFRAPRMSLAPQTVVCPLLFPPVVPCCSTSAASSDWRSVSRFHVGTGHREPTFDAGYTTACASYLPPLSISFLAFGGSPYTKG